MARSLGMSFECPGLFEVQDIVTLCSIDRRTFLQALEPDAQCFWRSSMRVEITVITHVKEAAP